MKEKEMVMAMGKVMVNVIAIISKYILNSILHNLNVIM